MNLISHPFRLAPDGTVATVDEDSAAAAEEAILVLLTTRKGERPLVPAFGITDPVFGRLSLAEVNLGLADFGPAGVSIDGYDSEWLDDRREAVTLTYDYAQEQ